MPGHPVRVVYFNPHPIAERGDESWSIFLDSGAEHRNQEKSGRLPDLRIKKQFGFAATESGSPVQADQDLPGN